MDRMSTAPLSVAVLAGGASSEREVSLVSGARVAGALKTAGHRIEMIDPAETELDAVDWSRFDGCFLALHGGPGEDGRVQRWLEDHAVAYTGSGPAASHAAMSKSISKELFRRHGVPTPDYALLRPSDGTEEILHKVRRLGWPVVIKPEGQGSSLGVDLARTAADLAERVARSRRFDPWTMAEHYISGRELTVSVLDRRPLPVLEVVGYEEIFDYASKYTSTVTQYRFDTGLPPIKIEEIRRCAVSAAAALETTGLVRVDLLLDEQQQPWVLEVNTLPGMTDQSMAPRAAAEAGLDLPALCNWMISKAVQGRDERTAAAA